ncbi:MAG: hypothetical protein ACOVJ8_09205 [Sediminibacterium sp.]
MKKILLLALVSIGIIASVNAQSSPLKDYLGKYTFAEGSPVAEIDLSEQDSVLVGNSAMGAFQLEKKGTDTFYLAAFDANVIFKRAADQSVESVSIFVQGMELIGKKMSTSYAIKEEDFYSTMWNNKTN